MIKQSSFSRRFLLLFLAFFVATTLFAQDFSFSKPNGLNGWKLPKREVRAVWLTTIGGLDWPRSYAQNDLAASKQKQELRGILDKLQRAGSNTVLFQMHSRHGSLSFIARTVGWMPLWRTRKVARLRPFGLCHRRMP